MSPTFKEINVDLNEYTAFKLMYKVYPSNTWTIPVMQPLQEFQDLPLIHYLLCKQKFY